MAVTEVTNSYHAYADYGNRMDKTGSENKAEEEGKASALKQMQDKYFEFDVTAGDFSQNQVSAKSRGFQGVAVSPAYLAKAENSEKTAKDLDEMLGGVESAQKWLQDAFRRDGLELVSCGYYIDENGNMGSWSLVKKKDSMFDGLAKQSEKDTERIREKREKAKEQEKAEEKRAAEKEEKQANSPKDKVFVTASSNKELLVRSKEALQGTTGKTLTEEERALGVDYRV